MDEAIGKISKLQKENEALKAKIASYEAPGEMRAYYAINRLLNQQADFLNEFDLKSQIKYFDREDKVYDRASDLWEKMPSAIEKMASLKAQLGVTGNEVKDTAIKPSFLDRAIQ